MAIMAWLSGENGVAASSAWRLKENGGNNGYQWPVSIGNGK